MKNESAAQEEASPEERLQDPGSSADSDPPELATSPLGGKESSRSRIVSAGGPLVLALHGESSPASPEPSVQDRVEFSPPIPAQAKIKAINTAVTL